MSSMESDLRPPLRFETERLILSAPRPEDVPDLHRAICDSWDQLHRWMAWAREIPQLSDSEAARARGWSEFERGECFSYYARLKDGNDLVAVAGLHTRENQPGVFEIGYWAHSQHQGHGYVTEVVLAIVKTAFELLQAKRIEIRCASANIKSQRVAERAGFRIDRFLADEDSLVYVKAA